ncbi:MAG: DNA polymerase III subunit chi [Methylotenera sp.]
MTRIEFYFNVADKQQAIANLVQAAIVKRRQIMLFAADEKMASDVSVSLWQNKPESFLPHVQLNHFHASVTPVIIGLQGSDLVLDLMQDDMLINLTIKQPSFFSRFTQLVELVSDDEQDRLAARARFKFYRDRGYEIKSIDHTQHKIE